MRVQFRTTLHGKRNSTWLHQEIAERVIKKVAPATRKRLLLAAKSSYTILSDDTGWVARITKAVVEFNSRRVDPADLAKAGMTEVGKDDWHRKFTITVGEPAAASEGQESDGPVIGVAEVAKAVTAAARSVKS